LRSQRLLALDRTRLLPPLFPTGARLDRPSRSRRTISRANCTSSLARDGDTPTARAVSSTEGNGVVISTGCRMSKASNPFYITCPRETRNRTAFIAQNTTAGAMSAFSQHLCGLLEQECSDCPDLTCPGFSRADPAQIGPHDHLDTLSAGPKHNRGPRLVSFGLVPKPPRLCSESGPAASPARPS
jgi:hypothetical protein